jgi:adenylyltransferase/sulfurtransferase
VGHLTLVDDDAVAVSNLHRQVLFGPDSVGRAKVDSAAAQLRILAPWCEVEPVRGRLGPANGAALLAGHDLVIDCTDGWPSRRDVAAAARDLGVPVVWGAAVGWFGQATVFGSRVSLGDVFPEGADLDLDTCEGQGVAAVTCGLVGTAMAALATGALLRPGSGEGTLLHVDARTARWREVAVGGRVDA